MAAEAQKNTVNDLDFCVKNKISADQVKSGNSQQRVIYHLYDSQNPLHMQFSD
jgi:hypothetical protein